MWRGLLVSVRDAAEAAAALDGGAEIIDIKEPRHGPLGAAAPETIAAIARLVGSRRPWTMACGELGEADPSGPAGTMRNRGSRKAMDGMTHPLPIGEHLGRVLSILEHPARPPAAVKIGLANTADSDWRGRLSWLLRSLPEGIDRIAVAYADWRRARSPNPMAVVEAAAELGCSGVLLDTFDKAACGLFGSFSDGSPALWVTAARAAGLGVAVAGRLSAEELPAAWALGPDVVGLRSAVCVNGRDGAVQVGLVRSAVNVSRG